MLYEKIVLIKSVTPAATDNILYAILCFLNVTAV